MAARRIRVLVTGRVQGVGFRPFVYRCAVKHGLTGRVSNAPSGVRVEAEGPPESVSLFLRGLEREPPAQARVEVVRVEEIPAAGGSGFEIGPSSRSGDLTVGMPPDLALCGDCARELLDPADRRARYPFINCTHCGPRFTIIQRLPYDRDRTSMAVFRQCAACAEEYGNPLDRRFDAQPNACPECGPTLRLIGAGGTEEPGDPIRCAAARIREGAIVAVKGLGGYHLACAALDAAAVARLRERKNRPAKSLAVMFASLDQVREHCLLSPNEEAEMVSVASPIVILRRRNGSRLSALVSPDTRDVGAFLPYTPVHHLLLREVSPLVMTSGNVAEEPIAQDERELERILGRIADCALVHNRAILRRCDDSVLKMTPGRRLFFRRSRGFVPDPISLSLDGPAVLACGAEAKNTFCITRGSQAFVSQHIGDLQDYPAYEFFRQAVADLPELLAVRPETVAHDMHPDYVSTRYALGLAGVRRVAVQHHHAHVASCMAEHGLAGPVIGVAFDGSGYGPDGTVWGGEFLVADLADYHRVGRLKPYRLPGGEAAILNPERMALSCVLAEWGAGEGDAVRRFAGGITEEDRELLGRMITAGLHSPFTSSAGRLFDAVSAMLGLCTRITYDGQAAVRLQAAADAGETGCYPHDLEASEIGTVLSFGRAIREIAADVAAGEGPGAISARFHRAVAAGIAALCRRIRDERGLGKVVLSGGVFQNDLLLSLATDELRRAGFEVYSHCIVPPNDGGIALGQAAVALARFGSRRTED